MFQRESDNSKEDLRRERFKDWLRFGQSVV